MVFSQHCTCTVVDERLYCQWTVQKQQTRFYRKINVTSELDELSIELTADAVRSN
jgi:hypothetical protein